jgi:hypothetical protein
MNVELIYDTGCPNVAAARSVLMKAFARTGVAARWREWERSSPDAPAHVRHYGSPTILVDGKDAAGSEPSESAPSCRVYRDEHGKLARTPTLKSVCSALVRGASARPAPSSRWRAMLASFPAIGAAALPKLTCPLCFPAYAALLSAVGLEFVDYTPYLLPLTLAFLAVSVGVLALQARKNGNVVPLMLGISASLIVLIGKFGVDREWITTSGVVLLVAAVFLGDRKRAAGAAPCPACAADGTRDRAHPQAL